MLAVSAVLLLIGGTLAEDWIWGGDGSPKASVPIEIGLVVAPVSPTADCTCVAAYRCNTADIINFGAGVIDPRRICVGGDVCCSKPSPPTTTTTTTTTTTAKPAPLVGCGVSNPLGVGPGALKVLPGAQAAFGEFPWIAALLEKTPEGNRFLCGGTLISAKVILTAAHCVNSKNAGDMIARLGEWDAASTAELYPYQEVTGSSIQVHPDFYAGALFNDVALVVLSSAADTTKPNIGFACLPSPGGTYDLANCVTAGWGKQSFNNPGFSAIQKKTTVPVVQHSDCQTQLQKTRLGAQFRLHEKFMCAGKNGSDACTGDGGGPLMCPKGTETGRLIQVGVVSWGIGCGDSPGVYADLTQLYAWVKTNSDKVV